MRFWASCFRFTKLWFRHSLEKIRLLLSVLAGHYRYMHDHLKAAFILSCCSLLRLRMKSNERILPLSFSFTM